MSEDDGLRALFPEPERLIDESFLEELTQDLAKTDVGQNAAEAIAGAVKGKYSIGSTVRRDDLLRYVGGLVQLLRATRAAQEAPQRRWFRWSLRTMFMVVTAAGRRAFRFTIRTLLVLIAALAVAMAVYVNSANRQRLAVAKLKQLGAYVRYDYQQINSKAQPPGPTWLRERLGIDYFATVSSVVLNRPDIRDEHWDALRDLPHLRELHLWYANVQDAGFVHVRDLSQLTTVVLAHCKATDETLGNLCHLTQLEVLIVNNTLNAPKTAAITDAGLARLASLRGLTRLELNASNVTDAGIVDLTGLSKLAYLSLVGTEMSDDGIAELKKELPACRVYTGPPP
jgi:hypothetical protein